MVSRALNLLIALSCPNKVGGFLITLDHRNLKTPAGSKLVVPRERRLLALLIANEWENQDEVLKQHALPVVSSSPFLP